MEIEPDTDGTTTPAAPPVEQTAAPAAPEEASPRLESNASAVAATTPEPRKTESGDDTDVPVSALATVVQSLFSPIASAGSGEMPDSPAASPLLWTLAAYARRQVGEPTIHDRRHANLTSQTTAQDVRVQANRASVSIPGDADGSPIIGADGTVYQVTTDSFDRVSRVSILDNTGQIVATSDDIPGMATRAVARPDGTLVLLSTTFGATTVSSIDAEGNVTRIARLIGQPVSQVTVGSDGALYFRNAVPKLFSPTGEYVGYRTFRISPQDSVRSFSFDTDLAVAPDGTAYLVSSRFGFSTFRVIPSSGLSRARSLPFGVDPGEPILDQAGAGHVAVGIAPFGVEQTRVYTSTGGSISMRTISGLPGDSLVGADGVYLQTYTDAGAAYISRITATSVDTSDAIDGRLVEFQVSEDGTVYGAIDDPDAAEASVAVVDRDGTVRTLALPGTLVLGQRAIRDGGAQNAEDVGYFNYRTDGREFIAVLGPDGTVVRTIELPEGATGGSVFFGPDGAAYELLEYRNAAGEVVSRQILALSTTTFTANVPGKKFRYTDDDVVFGPDGIGYLLTGSETGLPGNPVDLEVLGFNAEGETVVRAGGLTNPATSYEDNPYREVLAFGRDGTAYVTLYFTADDPGVYAVTATGAQKVADLQYVPYQVGFPPSFGLDGTGYVTHSQLLSTDPDAAATVTVFSPWAAP